jgi:hypothetical protein
MDRSILKRATLHRKKVTQMCSNFGKPQKVFVTIGATFMQFSGEMAYFRNAACRRLAAVHGLGAAL